MLRLTEKFEVHNDQQEVILSLPAGSTITPIRRNYLPENTEAQTQCYTIYMKGRYFFVPKNICEVSTSETFFYGDY